MSRLYVTHFDSNYAAKGIVMLQSLLQNDPEALVTVYCLDRQVFSILSEWFGEQLELKPFNAITSGSIHMWLLKRYRQTWEYYATQKPEATLRVLQQHSERTRYIIWVDADLWFLSSPVEAIENLGENSVGITPHRYSDPNRKNKDKYGKFNAGFIIWRNDKIGIACLRRWARDCRRWCFNRRDGDKWMNQAYLDHWPGLFAKVGIIQHPGVNAANWNIEDKEIINQGGRVTVNGESLICYHFSGFDYELLNRPDDAGVMPLGDAFRTDVLEPYISALRLTSGLLKQKFGITGLSSVR